MCACYTATAWPLSGVDSEGRCVSACGTPCHSLVRFMLPPRAFLGALESGVPTLGCSLKEVQWLRKGPKSERKWWQKPKSFAKSEPLRREEEFLLDSVGRELLHASQRAEPDTSARKSVERTLKDPAGAMAKLLASLLESHGPSSFNVFGEKIEGWDSSCPSWMPGYHTHTHGFCQKLEPPKEHWFAPARPAKRSIPVQAPGGWEPDAQELRQEQQSFSQEPQVGLWSSRATAARCLSARRNPNGAPSATRWQRRRRRYRGVPWAAPRRQPRGPRGSRRGLRRRRKRSRGRR